MAIEDELLELAKQIEETNKLARAQLASAAAVGNTVTVVHKTSGSNILAVICASIAGLCLVATLLLAHDTDRELNREDHELHDLRAWKDIHQNHISALEAKQK